MRPYLPSEDYDYLKGLLEELEPRDRNSTVKDWESGGQVRAVELGVWWAGTCRGTGSLVGRYVPWDWESGHVRELISVPLLPGVPWFSLTEGKVSRNCTGEAWVSHVKFRVKNKGKVIVLNPVELGDLMKFSSLHRHLKILRTSWNWSDTISCKTKTVTSNNTAGNIESNSHDLCSEPPKKIRSISRYRTVTATTNLFPRWLLCVISHSRQLLVSDRWQSSLAYLTCSSRSSRFLCGMMLLDYVWVTGEFIRRSSEWS